MKFLFFFEIKKLNVALYNLYYLYVCLKYFL